MTPDVGLRELHKRQTRAALLRSAEQLFDERGFHATTVRAIAESAGVTERTFFRYFASKDDLVVHDMNDWLTLLEEALTQTDASLPVFAAIETAVLVTLDHPGPVAAWLFPADAAGKPGQKPNATSGVAARIAEILQRWLQPTAPSDHDPTGHPIAARRIVDRFQATVLARASVGVVRTAIAAATQTAALTGDPVSLDNIKDFVSRGFAVLAESSLGTGPEPRANR